MYKAFNELTNEELDNYILYYNSNILKIINEKYKNDVKLYFS